MKITLTPEECRKAISEYLSKKSFNVNPDDIKFDVTTDRFDGTDFSGASIEIKETLKR